MKLYMEYIYEKELFNKIGKMLDAIEIPEFKRNEYHLKDINHGKAAKIILKNEHLSMVNQIVEWCSRKDEHYMLEDLNSDVRRELYNVSKELDKLQSIDNDFLLSEAWEAFDKAIEKFDPYRGYKFTTYAFWWIFRSVCNAICYYKKYKDFYEFKKRFYYFLKL